jgi:hypothetical protein
MKKSCAGRVSSERFSGSTGLSIMMNTTIASFAAGLLGGLVGAYAFTQVGPAALPAASAAAAHPQDVISASRFQLTDARGKLRAELAMSADGGPGLFFFDSAGRNRLVLGLYSAAEGEAPSIVLNDSQQRAAGIFRLFGARDAPVVVLKSQGRDRSVYGLNPTSMDPFLANFASDGKKGDVFGNY